MHIELVANEVAEQVGSANTRAARADDGQPDQPMVVVVIEIGYMLTPERLCMEGEQPIWEPATDTSKCQADAAITDPGSEVVRVAADRHVPTTRDDPDYRQWERTVHAPVAHQQTAPLTTRDTRHATRGSFDRSVRTHLVRRRRSTIGTYLGALADTEGWRDDGIEPAPGGVPWAATLTGGEAASLAVVRPARGARHPAGALREAPQA